MCGVKLYDEDDIDASRSRMRWAFDPAETEGSGKGGSCWCCERLFAQNAYEDISDERDRREFQKELQKDVSKAKAWREKRTAFVLKQRAKLKLKAEGGPSQKRRAGVKSVKVRQSPSTRMFALFFN